MAHKHPLTRHLVPASAALALLLAGCGTTGTPTASDTVTPQGTAVTSTTQAPTGTDAGDGPSDGTAESSAPQPTTGGAQPDPGWTTDQKVLAAGAGTLLSITDVRAGGHDGYDRVVVELDGQGTAPGYDVRYVPAAYADGSGELLDVAGAAVLEVRVTGWGYPFDTGAEEYSGPRTLPGPGTSVAQVRLGSGFEGVAQVFIGVAGSQKPFAVTRLDGPPRIVVDVAH